MQKKKRGAKGGKQAGLSSSPGETLLETCRRVKNEKLLISNPIPLGEVLCRIERQLNINHAEFACILGVERSLITDLIANEYDVLYPYESLSERFDEIIEFMKALNLTVFEWQLCPTGDFEEMQKELHSCVSPREAERRPRDPIKEEKLKRQKHFFNLLKQKLREKNLSDDLEQLPSLAEIDMGAGI